MSYEKSDTCLLISKKGELYRLKCPFLVRLNYNAIDGKYFKVSKVIFLDTNIILFEIEGKPLNNVLFTPVRWNHL